LAEPREILFDNCDIPEYYKGIMKDNLNVAHGGSNKDEDDGGEEGVWARGTLWKSRDEIALWLKQSHRQVVVPGNKNDDSVNDRATSFFSKDSTIRTANHTNTRAALIDLDRGETNPQTGSIETIRMIFTQRDIPVTESGITQWSGNGNGNGNGDEDVFGWEPGYLWPVDDLEVEAHLDEFFSRESSKRYHHQNQQDNAGGDDELLSALLDLHNLRPRNPNLHGDHLSKDWYYDACNDCKPSEKTFIATTTEGTSSSSLRQKIDPTNIKTKTDGSNANPKGKSGGGYEVNSEGSDHLCVCSQEHSLQPPERARGEIARALLYMELRYGTPDRDAYRGSFLGLSLTDCHPTDDDNDETVDKIRKSLRKMGYFSRLVEWHLDDPPSEREIERNNKICQFYQGNRNPFVDFYEESWELLDFESVERESCTGAVHDDYYDDYYYDDDDKQYEELSVLQMTRAPAAEQSSLAYGCSDLKPGDVSFFMVQPATEAEEVYDFDQNEKGYQQAAFGLVPLVNLKPGLVLYVAGADDDDDDDESNIENKREKDRDVGILKIVLPENGVSAGSYFGYGEYMYLGDRWEPVVEETGNENDTGEPFWFSVQQLYLYCVGRETTDIRGSNSNSNSNSGGGGGGGIVGGESQSTPMEEYKILAALSTTGKSFASDDSQWPVFWEIYEQQHANIKPSEDAKYLMSSMAEEEESSSSSSVGGSDAYGIIVLPQDASSYESSGGYMYDGPSYQDDKGRGRDQFASDLVNQSYWKRIHEQGGPNAEDPLRLADGINYASSGHSSSMATTSSLWNMVAFTALLATTFGSLSSALSS